MFISLSWCQLKVCLSIIRSQFIKLPAQALPSKLAYIEPFDGVWLIFVIFSVINLCCIHTSYCGELGGQDKVHVI